MENLVPHINAPVEFNQDTLKSARERRNRLQRERCAMQHIESARPFEMPQERSNHLHQERQLVQQAITHAQPSLSHDALQLFAELARPFETPQERSNLLCQERRIIQ